MSRRECHRLNAGLAGSYSRRSPTTHSARPPTPDTPPRAASTPRAGHNEPGRVSIGAAAGRYFHLPLWLQLPCRGETLRAYNARHLGLLEGYAGAGVRGTGRDGEFGRSSQSLAGTLPARMKSAKNRAEVMKSLAKLRGRLA